jgi:hypothetical protein
MRELFGMEDRELPAELDERSLFDLYRTRLKTVCGLAYAADLRIPHPTHERTWFRLVVAGRHPAVIELFRSAELKVIGKIAGTTRTEARRRRDQSSTAQGELGFPAPPMDPWFERERGAELADALAAATRKLVAHGALRWGAVWPVVLEEHHVTRPDLVKQVLAAAKRGEIAIEPLRARRRGLDEDDILRSPVDRDPNA